MVPGFRGLKGNTMSSGGTVIGDMVGSGDKVR